MMLQKHTRIGFVMGDAAGIGPEIVLRTLVSDRVGSRCDPLGLGSYEVLALASQIADLGREIVPVTTADAAVTDPSAVRVLDCTVERNPDFR